MLLAMVNQPQTNRQLLRQSLSLYKSTFTRVFLVGMLLSLTAFLPRLISLIIGNDVLTLPITSPHRLWFILVDLICLMFFAEIIWRIQCKMRKMHETAMDDLKAALKKLPLIFLAAIVEMLILAIIAIIVLTVYFFLNPNILTGNVLFTLASSAILLLQSAIIIYLFFLFYFFIPLILTENKGIFSSLKRSAYLVFGNFWRTITLQMTPWFIYIICLVLINYIIHVNVRIFFVTTQQNYDWLGTILQILLFGLFIPWIAAILLVQLRDLEVRKKITTSS